MQKCVSDEAELARLGYPQQLRRGMSGFANFALSFSVISILTGAVSLYDYGIAHGGPIEMTLGWPLVTGMTLLVACSLAELASAYPTAGALYHWASILGGPRVGWWTAWFNLIGQVAVLAGVDYVLARFIAEEVGIGAKPERVLLLYAMVLASHGALNHLGVRTVTLLNELSAWYHLAGTALLVGVLSWRAHLQPISFLLERYVAPGRDGSSIYPFWYAALIGLLQAQWTFTGYDASAHAAEETRGAREAAPRGMVHSVMVSGVAGFVMLMAITLAIRDLPSAATENGFILVVNRALGAHWGTAIVWMVIGAMWFCGLSTLTSSSRMLFAFARDGGPPGAARLARVSDRFRTPTWSIWICVGIALALAIWGRAFSVIVSISTIGLYVSYGLPILLVVRARKRREVERGPWNLGRWSTLVNVVALGWIAGITILFMLPPNQRTGTTFAGLLLVLGAYDIVWASRRFKGPAQLKSRAQPAIPSSLTEGRGS